MNHGGRREGAGRPQGSTNRATKEQGARLSELARLHTEMALDTLVDIASNGMNENARIAAATAILDRGYGRAAARVHQYAADIMAIYYKDVVAILGKLIHEARPEVGRQRSRQLSTLAISLIEGHSLFNQMNQFAKGKTSLSKGALEKTIMVLLDN